MSRNLIYICAYFAVLLVIGFVSGYLTFVTLQQEDVLRSAQELREEQRFATIDGPNGLRLSYFAAVTDPTHRPDRVFDGSTAPDSFWEVGEPFPIELIIDLPEPRAFSSYALACGETGSRMPLEWQLDGSRSGATWIPLDRPKATEPWKDNEARRFQISFREPLRRLRFRFLSSFGGRIIRIYEIELR